MRRAFPSVACRFGGALLGAILLVAATLLGGCRGTADGSAPGASAAAPEPASGASEPRPRISAEHPVTSPPALAAGVWDRCEASPPSAPGSSG